MLVFILFSFCALFSQAAHVPSTLKKSPLSSMETAKWILQNGHRIKRNILHGNNFGRMDNDQCCPTLWKYSKRNAIINQNGRWKVYHNESSGQHQWLFVGKCGSTSSCGCSCTEARYVHFVLVHSRTEPGALEFQPYEVSTYCKCAYRHNHG